MHVHSPFESKAAAAGPGPAGLGRNLLHILLWAIILPIPMVLAATGAWVGSTLAVHHGQPVWVALVGAVLVFGVLPLLWELAADRHQVGGRLRDAILRSSFLSFVLIAVLLATHAKTTYLALATRGDWFLANAKTPAAESIRRFVFKAADGFQWLDDWVRDVGYGWADTTGDIDPSNSAVSFGRSLRSLRNKAGGALGEKPPLPRHPIDGTSHTWPLPDGPHPLVAEIIATNPESPAAVGKWVAEHVPDGFTRVVVIHDFVITWLRYDYDGLVSGSYKNPHAQEASNVFRRRTGVCAGFAALFEAVAKAGGLNAVVVSGIVRLPFLYVRDSAISDMEPGARRLTDTGHAWNAVEVDGRWHLVDATWDEPFYDGPPKRNYLFPPPEAMLATHLPDNKKWQLRTPPTDYGPWLRMPHFSIEAHYFGITLVGLDRPIQPREDVIRIEIDNPHERVLSVVVDRRVRPASFDEFAEDVKDAANNPDRPIDKDAYFSCGARTDSTRAIFECPAPDGAFHVNVFGRTPGNSEASLLASVYYREQ